MYLHPSFTENPWEKLERQMIEEMDSTPTNSGIDVDFEGMWYSYCK